MNRIDLHARYERLRLLYQVTKVIHSTLEPNQVLRLIVNEAVRVMRATSGSIALLNPTTQLLEIQAARGIPALAAERRLRLGEGITGWATCAPIPAMSSSGPMCDPSSPCRSKSMARFAAS
jgi:signal transduction protein with GAF and PtsI domain